MIKFIDNLSNIKDVIIEEEVNNGIAQIKNL